MKSGNQFRHVVIYITTFDVMYKSHKTMLRPPKA